MTEHFKTVANDVVKLPRTAFTQEIVEAWSYGLKLLEEDGEDDFSVLIHAVLSKKKSSTFDELFADTIIVMFSFVGLSNKQELMRLLWLFHIISKDDD